MSTPQLRLRPAAADDEPFLREVYASTREAELAQVSWTAEQKAAFIDHQHRAQSSAYRSAHPDGQFLVIELDGMPVGRLYLSRLSAGELRILDIALLPDHCGQGIGGVVLRGVLAEADREGVAVSLHVERWNPAVHLYQRHGFRETARNDVHLRMDRPPRPVS